MEVREATQSIADIKDDIFVEFFVKTYPKYKKYAYVILPSEVLSLGERGLTPEEIAVMEKRLKGYAFLNNKLIGLDELEAELCKNNMFLEKDEVDKNIRTIEGVATYFGKVTGRVRLVLRRQDVATVKEGEIIVAEMTSPDFMPAIKKAAAIVTDEGGITCHAAIIARELKKPCIVGTKSATQVLKDGEMSGW